MAREATTSDSTSRESKRSEQRERRSAAARDPFLRAPNEDDDGYDPYSDRPATAEPLFAEDPWR